MTDPTCPCGIKFARELRQYSELFNKIERIKKRELLACKYKKIRQALAAARKVSGDENQ